MHTAIKPESAEGKVAATRTMRAAVYRGKNDVRLETVPVPEIGKGELLVKVHTCGIGGTDLKKILTGSHSEFSSGQCRRCRMCGFGPATHLCRFPALEPSPDGHHSCRGKQQRASSAWQQPCLPRIRV